MNDMLIKALATALSRVPAANVAYAGEDLMQFDRVDISIAVATEKGIVTPVVRDAASLSVLAISTTMALLVDRVRPEQRGLAVSTYFTGFDIGISVGSIGFGALLASIDIGAMWLLAAACVLLGLPGLWADRRAGSERRSATLRSFSP